MSELPHFKEENRPWGGFLRFTLNEKSSVKIITVTEGEAFSLQTHTHRAEYWYIVKGEGIVVVGEKTFTAKPGDQFYIHTGEKHRATGGTDGLQLLEIAFGEFAEEDITRLEDNYGRI